MRRDSSFVGMGMGMENLKGRMRRSTLAHAQDYCGHCGNKSVVRTEVILKLDLCLSSSLSLVLDLCFASCILHFAPGANRLLVGCTRHLLHEFRNMRLETNLELELEPHFVSESSEFTDMTGCLSGKM